MAILSMAIQSITSISITQSLNQHLIEVSKHGYIQQNSHAWISVCSQQGPPTSRDGIPEIGKDGVNSLIVVPYGRHGWWQGQYLFSAVGPSVVLPPSHAQVVTKAREGHTLILTIYRHS